MEIETIAVLGSGTMGAGIAQAALAAGCTVALYDVSDTALARAQERIAAGLARQGRGAAASRLRLTIDLGDLAGAALVVEAAPENAQLKRDLIARVGAICPPPCIIASNTSSLPIAALAAACPGPERVAGLHFFNPVHRMALVEVVRAPQTGPAVVAALRGFAERLGKTPVLARDTPGFLVNRVARPFYGEALRMLGEQAAPHTTIDTALQLAGGFPLGPFALMDLIGIDINFAVTQSMYEQSFGEPRYRPHPIQQQMVLAGTLGRKTGAGFYRYDAGEPPARSAPPAERPSLSGSVLLGEGGWAPGLTDLLADARLPVVLQSDDYLSFGTQYAAVGEPIVAIATAGRAEGLLEQVAALDLAAGDEVLLLAQCADVAASEIAGLLRYPERFVGFDGLFTDGAITLVATALVSEPARQAAELLVRALGREPVWVADSPGLIVPRVVAMLANEAAFAVGEGVADAATVDTAMRLGANHPAGPLARAARLGYDTVVAILDHLHAEFGEDRYRVAPALRRAARVGRL